MESLLEARPGVGHMGTEVAGPLLLSPRAYSLCGDAWGPGTRAYLHNLTRLLSGGAMQPVLWSEARSQLPPVCDSKKRACAYFFTGGLSISMSLSHHAAPFLQSSTSPIAGLIGMRVILGKTPVLPPNRKTLLCLPLILIPGAAGNNEVCA